MPCRRRTRSRSVVAKKWIENVLVTGEGDNHRRYTVAEKRAQRKIENDGGDIEFSHRNV